MQNLLFAVKELIAQGVTQDDETGEECRLLMSRVDWAGQLILPEPASLSFVEDNLEAACRLSGSEGSAVRAVADAVWACSGQLCWHSMYAHYEDEPDMAAFRRTYGYIDLISPDGPLICPDIYMGMSLQGPDAFYPPHAHKAVETYVIIGGKGDWKRGAEPWRTRSPGEFFLHTSGVRHATQSNDEPLLSLAFWTSDLNSPIVIIRA